VVRDRSAARSAVDGGPGTSRLLTGWGRTAPTGGFVIRPEREPDAIGAIGPSAPARGVIARGLGRSYGDAAQNAGGRVLDTGGLGGVRRLDLEAGTVTVGAGISLDELIRLIVPFGWFLPVTPGTRFVTVGGAIASDVHGKNHHRDGGFADHLVSMRLLTPDGRTRVLSRDGAPEAFDATAGGMGLTGIVLEATIRMLRIRSAWMRVDTERASDLEDLMDRMAATDHRYRYSVAWIDCLASGSKLGRAVLTRGDHADAEGLPSRRRRQPLRFDATVRLSVPPGVPGGLLGAVTAWAFNEMWFRKAPRAERGRPTPLAAFFHPLDGLGAWNRLYGPRGFIQYQFVVPFGEERIVRRVLEDLSRSGCPSFLSVLKRFGPGRGLLSFPIAGWTLALDIPARTDGLAPILDAFDRLVADAGGRVYLSKDARLRPELLAEMYPELDRWREIRERLDPNHVMRSDLARRLDLTGPAPNEASA
jgi:decaprenylphospho-beta-D-ribofuranose 2-oxidase